MIKEFFRRDFFNDRPVVVLAVAGLALGVFNLLGVLIGVRASDFEVPVRYTQYGTSPLSLGEWYGLYELGVFAVLMPLINIVLAVRFHQLHRYIAIVLLLLTLLAGLFLFMVTRAILGLTPTI